MEAYRKLIAAVVGVGALLIFKYLNFDIAPWADQIVEGVIALLTAVGVWAVPNKPA